jgi:adenylate cyclase
VSPNTIINSTYSRGPALAWDTPDFGDHRKELLCLEPTGAVPSISRQQPSDFTPPPYGRHNRPTHLSSNLFNNSFYNSSSDDLPQMSPGFVPQNINNLSLEWHGEDRRPSVASTTTMSSTGSSKRSITGKFHKKLETTSIRMRRRPRINPISWTEEVATRPMLLKSPRPLVLVVLRRRVHAPRIQVAR